MTRRILPSVVVLALLSAAAAGQPTAFDPNATKMTAREWSDAMADCLLVIRKSADVDGVVLAYRRGRCLDARNLELHTAYMDRMLRLGVLHMAYEPARALSAIQPENVTVQAVLSHMYAGKDDMPAALKATLAVLKACPQDPSALYNFGQLAAWCELDPDGPKIDDAIKRNADAMREKCKPLRTYQVAHARGRGVYEKRAQIEHKYDKRLRALDAEVADAQKKLDALQTDVRDRHGGASADEAKVTKLKADLAAADGALAAAGTEAERAPLRATRNRLRNELAAAEDATRRHAGQLDARTGDRDAASADLQKKKEQLGALRLEKKAAMEEPDSDWRWDPPTLEGKPIAVVTRIEGSKLIMPPWAEEEAARMLQRAQFLAVNGANDKAREGLNEILRIYGATEAGRQAAEMLKKLPEK